MAVSGKGSLAEKNNDSEQLLRTGRQLQRDTSVLSFLDFNDECSDIFAHTHLALSILPLGVSGMVSRG